MFSASRSCLLTLLFSLPAGAEMTGPYAVDADTVHLFHMDEAAGASSASNSFPGGRLLISFNGTGIPATNTSAQPTLTTLLGSAGAVGFGNAANVSATSQGLGLDANNSGAFQPGTTGDGAGNSNGPDAITQSSLAGASGSFTVEALVRLPAITGPSREIISTDSSGANRGFQFRINGSGELEFNFIKTAAAGVAVTIPLSGPHGFVANEWFHAAVAFNGTNGSCNFFWTRLAETSDAANSIGIRTEATDATVTGPLVIGNEGRGSSGEGLLGMIDEVRISKVARTASQFLFTIVDVDGDGLSDRWEIACFRENAGESDSSILAKFDSDDDPDKDGANNAAEFASGTNPTNPNSSPNDSDADGLPDTWEIANFSSIIPQAGGGDADGDFATNRLEYLVGTNPNNPLGYPDTDTDGMNDGWEIHNFLTIQAKDGIIDSDEDGASDKVEHDANTHPLNALWSPSSAQLAHRWSFNNSLEDTAGGRNAVIVDPDSNPASGGGATLSSTAIQLGGGSRATSGFVNLGSGLLAGRRTPVTLEFWVTRIGAPQNWARIFDFGSATGESLFMAWTRGTDGNSDRVEWTDNGTTSAANDTVRPYTAGVRFHILMTLEPRVGAVGTTRVTCYAAPATGSTLGASKGAFDTINTMNQLNDAVCWLGRSQWASDATASASYDEVRIWNGALTPAERETYHTLGSDAASLEDSEPDGLPDAWELKYVVSLEFLSGLGNSDYDADGSTDLSEYRAGSNPASLLSTATDIDADGLSDAMEGRYFGNLAQTATGDPDGDGVDNATEISNGSAPNNKASDAADIDADSLPDAWELSHFSALVHNGGSDPDGDGFGNLQEYQANTLPASSSSRPAGTSVNLVPVDDGDAATSDFGYSGSSAINSVSFVRSSLKTVGTQQFMTWYGRHQYDAADVYNNTIWIGRRTLGTSGWEIFRHSSFTANAITDGHDVIAFGIDGEGYMHLSWGMHGDAFHYAKSLGPVTGNGPMTLGPDTTMTGRENGVTYPQFMTLPDGDLLYLFREGFSGSGDIYLNRYDTATRIWTSVHSSGNTHLPFIKGTGWNTDYNAYVNMPQLGLTDGNELTLTWCWRYSSGTSDTGSGAVGYQTNSNFYFARSPDAGVTWKRFDGTPYVLPISSIAENGVQATRAERIVNIPENSSLINQSGMCLDRSGNPVIATWWAPETPAANFSRQYMVVFRHDNGTWQTRPVSNRTIDPGSTRFPEGSVRNMGRPVVVNDDSDRMIVAYRDNEESNGMTIVHSLPKSQDPDRTVWIQFELTTGNLGNYEPTIDNELWDRERRMHFLYQSSDGQGYTSPANTASRISVLEWDAAIYFDQQPQPGVAFSADKSQITITCPSEPSWAYRLWSSTDLKDWTLIETRAGTGERLEFVQPNNVGELKRFWKIGYKEGGF